MKHFTLNMLALATVAGSVVFSSCKKEDEDPKPKTKTELLTAKSWRITADMSSYTTGGTTVNEDNYADYQACEKDDFIKFEASKAARFDEGTIRCGTNPQTQTGSWDFNSDQSKLLLTDPDNGSTAIPFDIVELTESTLKIKFSASSGGVAASQTITMASF